MKFSNRGGRSADYRSPVIAKQRAFLAFARDMASERREKKSQKEITDDLCRLVDDYLPPGSAPIIRVHVSAVPRIIQVEGECNWQVLVFLPVPSEVLEAAGRAGEELQGRYDMADFFQGTRALIV